MAVVGNRTYVLTKRLVLGVSRYFVGISIVGFKIMQHEPYFPPPLGGNGVVLSFFDRLSEPPCNALKYYFMVQLGYHLHSLLFMVFFSPIRNDFVEMLLHHVATIFLIGGSFLVNYTAYGALVAYTHDLGDVFGCTCIAKEIAELALISVTMGFAFSTDGIKSIVDTGKTPLLVLMYLMLLVSWAHTRLYVFPCYLIHAIMIELPSTHPEIPIVFNYPMIAMLCMLVVLHVYWYFLFLVMGYSMLNKGVAEDIQHKINGPSEDDKPERVSAECPRIKSKDD